MFLEKIQQQQNLKELMRLTLINILNAKGVIYNYYKQQQERELNGNKNKLVVIDHSRLPKL
jgi:hypothetical protein